MSDSAKLEYTDGRVIITRCFSEQFNEELKALPREERGFDWDEKHWWADDVHGSLIVAMMVRHFGSVQVFGCPRHGDYVIDRGGMSRQSTLF
jgi:hypothetical protein